jgi:adenylosuccinate synthase
MKTKPILVILSGNLCTGKSTLSNKFAQNDSFQILKSREVLKKIAPEDYVSKFQTVREGLINYALELDKHTNGSWIADNLHHEIFEKGKVILDCIRLISQLEALKRKFNDLVNIYHIHLKCSDNILSQRFSDRDENKRNNIEISETDFSEAKEHIIELQSSELESYANLVIETDNISKDDVYNKVVLYLKLNKIGD